jgi:hypothetical protein
MPIVRLFWLQQALVIRRSYAVSRDEELDTDRMDCLCSGLLFVHAVKETKSTKTDNRLYLHTILIFMSLW